MRTYRISALASASLRMWRGWTVLVPVVIINALLQGLLVWPPFTYDSGVYTAASAVGSALVFLVAYGLVASVALDVAEGRVGWGKAWGRLREHLGRYVLWAVLLSIVVIVGLAIHTLPGLLVLAVTPFLLLATLDGQRNPLARNFRTIAHRFWRWLVTASLAALGILLGTIIAGFTAFFWRGGVAALLVWLVAGLLIAWVTVAWGLIFRSAWAEPAWPELAADPDLEPA